MKKLFKVNLDKVGLESADKAYGGYLNAFSFFETSFDGWFSDFRELLLSKMGKEYFPIYRMADGEYRFTMGRSYNLHKRPLYREIIAVTAEKLRIKNPDKWKTSWGEEYPTSKVKELRIKLIRDIRYISTRGMLACYFNENGLHAFEEHNKQLIPFFKRHDIVFNKGNYVPFHFICGVLVKQGWQDFFLNKHVLIVTGIDDTEEKLIKETILDFNSSKVSFLRISKTKSMEEDLDLSLFKNEKVDIILVAAGIGSANILRQLEPLQTLTVDIGGYMNCFKDPNAHQHGGIFKLPNNV